MARLIHRCTWLRFALVGMAIATSASAAELIRVPEGVLVRSLFDWEAAEGLEVSLGGSVRNAPRTADGAEFRLSLANLCESAAYRVIAKSTRKSFVNLDHLCRSEHDASVTFALIADTQELHDEHRRTAALLTELADAHPEVSFVITAGDIVDRGTLTEWRAYRHIAANKYTYKLPIVPVIGNHEYKDDDNLAYFQKVYGTDSTRNGWYAIDLGPAVLLVLNSSMEDLSSSQRAAQTQWLAEALAAYAPVKPILATYHHPAYSTGIGHIFMPIPPEYIKRNWLPLFSQYGVKLVMNGHEHVYERLLVNGVQYLNAGPAGGTMGRVKPSPSKYSQKVLKNARTVSIVTVSRNGSVDIKTYASDQDGALVDEYSF